MFSAWGGVVTPLKSETKIQTVPDTPLINLAKSFTRLAYFIDNVYLFQSTDFCAKNGISK